MTAGAVVAIPYRNRSGKLDCGAVAPSGLQRRPAHAKPDFN